MPEGTIKKLTQKGFGFIQMLNGKELFFHSSSLEGVRYEELHEGQKVSFVEGHSPKGPRAEDVRPAGLHRQFEPLTILLDPGSATPAEISELFTELSTLYRMLGGSGITFTVTDVKEPVAA